MNQDADGVTVELEQFFSKSSSHNEGSGVVIDGIVANATDTDKGTKPSSPVCSDGSAAQEFYLRASYVVGCDGANSTIRRLQKFTMTDLNFENDWLVADLVCRLEAAGELCH